MAKAIQAEGPALEALAALLGDPTPKVLHGSKGAPGVFAAASSTDKAAAKLCLDNRWLEPTGEFAGKGKTRKELFRISAAGMQTVLARKDPTDLLRRLQEGLAGLESKTAGVLPAVEANLAKALEEIKHAIAGAVQPLAGLGAIAELRQSVGHVLERIKPLDLTEVLARMSSRPAAPASTASSSSQGSAAAPKEETGDAMTWGAEVVRLAAEQRQANPFQRLTLPQVYQRLITLVPRLTLGQFHDGMRRLHQERRIRLGPYTQALATLDDPQNALYLDREVKYYVEPA